MSVSFNELNLSLNDEVKTFSFNDKEIEVKQHLSTVNKNDLIQIALQKSYENGLYNEILSDVYFHLNIVYLYTNIDFTEEDRVDELELYDKLNESGLLSKILTNMDEDEYDNLVDIINTEMKNRVKYNNSAAAVIQSIIQDLPANAAAAADIVNGWDPEKFQSVQDMINLARATGMNPPLPSSESKDEATAADHDDKIVNFLEEQAKQEE